MFACGFKLFLLVTVVIFFNNLSHHQIKQKTNSKDQSPQLSNIDYSHIQRSVSGKVCILCTGSR